MDEIRIFSDEVENEEDAPIADGPDSDLPADSGDVDVESLAVENVDQSEGNTPFADEQNPADEDDPADDDDDEFADEDVIDLNGDDLEEAYRRALEALDVAEEQAGETLGEHPSEDSDNPETEDADEFDISESADGERRISPRHVIEAVLFVGGESVTTRKLCSVIRGEFTPEQVTRQIESLNEQYTREQRPYEIVMNEGGYTMKLRPGFDAISRKVFGMGPREIKLSQEVLEVLALVAYRQPITRAEIDECGRSNLGGLLRQLVRRQLIAVDRSNGGGKKLTYTTTSRFLAVFGIGDPKELPLPETIEFR